MKRKRTDEYFFSADKRITKKRCLNGYRPKYYTSLSQLYTSNMMSTFQRGYKRKRHHIHEMDIVEYLDDCVNSKPRKRRKIYHNNNNNNNNKDQSLITIMSSILLSDVDKYHCYAHNNDMNICNIYDCSGITEEKYKKRISSTNTRIFCSYII